jgi:hypothetical protein
MGIYPELDGLGLAELRYRFRGEPIDGWEYAASWFEEVAIDIAEHGEPGVTFLNDAMDAASGLRKRAILLALAMLPETSAELKARLALHLNDSDPMLVAAAVDGLRYQDASEYADEVTPLLGHASPYVRGSVLRFLGDTDAEHVLPILLAALSDEHYIVRENAVDELDDLEAVEALPAVLPLLDDPHPHVRQAAETFVDHWGGES